MLIAPSSWLAIGLYMLRKLKVYMCMYIGLKSFADVRCTMSLGCESVAAKFVREGTERQAEPGQSVPTN